MILLSLILLTNITLANQPFVYPHIPPLGVFAPSEPHLDPSNALLVMPPIEHRNVTYIIDTNGPCPDVDCNYLDTNGNCVLQKCPGAPPTVTYSCTIDPSQPSQLEVWHSYDATNWDIYAIVNGNIFTATNSGMSEYFRVRSTCPGFISAWNVTLPYARSP